MEFLFDTINIPAIQKYGACFPYTGVTSNPSIIKAEGPIDFFAHFREIRRIIGTHRTLHIQTLALDCSGILAEADKIRSNVDEDVYIKVPATVAGLEAMQALKRQGTNVTATAIYSKIQGFLAIAAGVDFIAPYYNRMENQDILSCDTIQAMADIINANNLPTKIVAASFKNIVQVNNAIAAGSHAVTVLPVLLSEAFRLPSITKAVADFSNDWDSIFGEAGILDL